MRTKHNIHLRTSSPIHYSHEESILNTLRFVGKDGREVFGMAIPDALLTDEITSAPYYSRYMEHVAEYQRCLDEEHDKAEEEDVTESPKAVKATKSKTAKQTKSSAPKASKETSNASSPAKQSKDGKVTKQRKPKSPLQLVDEFVDEGVPEQEPVYGDEEADIQRAVELSIKEQAECTQGPARSVVIREPDSGRIQLLPDVQGKGKEKVSDEQVALDLLTLQTLKKKSSAEQYIFQRRTPTTTEPSYDTESPLLYAELGLTNSQAGPNPGIQDEGQAGSNLRDAAESQPHSSHVVHAGPNLEHMDFEENLKLPTEDQVILEEPASSAGTMSSLQNIDKELSFTNQFLVEKSQEDEPDKSNTKVEVQSMVTVPIHQDTSSVPLMTTPVIDLTMSQPVSTMYKLENLNVPHQVKKAIDEVVIDAVDWAMQAPLRARFSDLPTVDMKEILHQRMFEDNSYEAHEVHANLFDALEKSLERDHSDQLLSDLDEAHRKKRKRRASPRTPPGSLPLQPPPPPPPVGASGALGTSGASGSTQLPPPPPPPPTGASGSAPQQGSKAPSSSMAMASTLESMAWTTSDTRYESTGVSADQDSSPIESLMHDDSTPDEQASALASSYEPPAENSLLAKTGDMTTFLNWYCRQINKSKLTQVDLEGQAYEVVKVNPKGDQVRINVNRPLPLGGPPGHVTIQTELFFNKDLEYLRFGNKGSMPVLSISKMKDAHYPDFGLELLVPEHMWIEDVCTYDISAKYGIDYWWFNRHKFYIDRHDSPSRRKEVRTHMRILSVARIKAYSRYEYDYLSEIVLRRADHQEHKIAEKDFKNMYPSDFEDPNLLLLQGHLDHLSGSDKRMLSTAVKLWTQNLVIRQRVEDFQLGIKSYQTQLNFTKP
ncbi:hypothetical protein Tco_1218435 [Tanacetum coccineum]